MQITGGSVLALQFKIDTKGIEHAIARAPVSAYNELRNFLGVSFLKHRSTWIQKRRSAGFTKFARRSSDPNAIRVHELNKGPLVPAKNEVIYHVLPHARRMQTEQEAEKGLRELRGLAFTGNVILPIHEFGQDIRSTKWMAVPVKTRPGAPKRWRAKYPNKELKLMPSKRGPSTMLLYEVIRRRGRGRPSKTGDGAHDKVRSSLRLRFVLTKFLDMKPTLMMYATWDGLAGERDRLWQAAASNILRALARQSTG